MEIISKAQQRKRKTEISVKLIAESLESRNKGEVNIICAAKTEVIETLKDLVQTFVYKAVKNSEI